MLLSRRVFVAVMLLSVVHSVHPVKPQSKTVNTSLMDTARFAIGVFNTHPNTLRVYYDNRSCSLLRYAYLTHDNQLTEHLLSKGAWPDTELLNEIYFDDQRNHNPAAKLLVTYCVEKLPNGSTLKCIHPGRII